MDHNADRATGLQHLAALAEDFDQDHDLRPEGVDQVRMMVDSIRHGQTPLLAPDVRSDASAEDRSLCWNAE